MSVAVKKIPGVEGVNVSLNKGLVSIKLTPGNKVRIARIRKAILDDAFTPKNARVSAIGTLVTRKGKLMFVIAGTYETFPVAPSSHQSWRKDVGREVALRGLLAAPAKGTQGGTLQVTSLSESPATGK